MSEATPDTPLIAAFTVQSGHIADGAAVLELSDIFIERLKRYLAGRGYAVAYVPSGIIHRLTLKSDALDAGILFRLIGNIGDRWGWQFWTSPISDETPLAAVAPLRHDLAKLAVAWQETEDVEAVLDVNQLR